MSNLQRFLLRLMLFIGSIAYLSLAHAAGVPPLINYQGTLTDAYGVPIPDATKAMEFNIYDAPSGGNLVWGPQSFATVPIIGGRFNVILGTTDSLGRSIANAFNADNRYLGIRAGSLTELAPRQQILTTAYAIRSLNAVNAMSANTALNGVPIGTILAWHKNMPNTPALPFGFVECNGQVLNDAASPYNAKTMPNLNGERRFLRGASQSGVDQAMDWKSFYIKSESDGGSYGYTHGPILIPKSDYNPVGLFGGHWSGSSANQLFFKFDDSEVRPINMSVVWIMRVK